MELIKQGIEKGLITLSVHFRESKLMSLDSDNKSLCKPHQRVTHPSQTATTTSR